MVKHEIICAGFGGQGIMLMGKLLAQSASECGYHVTWMPSYGAEVRGGTAHSMVIISDKEIACPVVFTPSVGLVMNKPSFDKFEPRIKKGGLLMVNVSMVDRPPVRKEINHLKIPASQIATALGNIRVQNMVMLGAFIQYSHLLPLEKLIACLKDILPAHRHNLIAINEQALKQGAALLKKRD